jgi:hypothetical protein
MRTSEATKGTIAASPANEQQLETDSHTEHEMTNTTSSHTAMSAAKNARECTRADGADEQLGRAAANRRAAAAERVERQRDGWECRGRTARAADGLGQPRSERAQVAASGRVGAIGREAERGGGRARARDDAAHLAARREALVARRPRKRQRRRAARSAASSPSARAVAAAAAARRLVGRGRVGGRAAPRRPGPRRRVRARVGGGRRIARACVALAVGVTLRLGCGAGPPRAPRTRRLDDRPLELCALHVKSLSENRRVFCAERMRARVRDLAKRSIAPVVSLGDRVEPVR